ncbi:MAG: 50S ribosomal protein L11 methyltransferase [Planctomycetota bacterium]|nr:50S ribosomal protein L11 methyltransferase [Planctomycetota bacterium]
MSDTSRWTEIRIQVPSGWHELVADALGQEMCTTVQVGDLQLPGQVNTSGFECLRSYVLTEWNTPELHGRLQAMLQNLSQAADAPELAKLQVEFADLPPEDYATSWQSSWKAFRLRRGERSLRVEPPWTSFPDREGETRLILEPGGAFGSGRHATTRTCMAVALERLKGGEKVLDAGSGSGILAVVSLLLGAESAFGFDIDEVATQSARDLAATNGVDQHARFETGGFEITEGDDNTYDVVFANIYSDVIVANANRLASYVRKSGWFAFSGCPHHHVKKTVLAMEQAGLKVLEDRQRGNWHTFVGKRA